MTQREFIFEIQKNRREFADLFRRKLPVVVGRMAKDHYQDNFRKGGFVNGGLKKWTPAKRLTSGRKGAAARYGTLLSSRNHLFSAVQYIPGDSRVTISNPVPYAAAHQFGDTIHVPITPKMRSFAWARYYDVGGGKKSGKSADNGPNGAEMWRRLALTKKTALTIKLPARPFIGESEELTRKIEDKIDTEVRKILNR